MDMKPFMTRLASDADLRNRFVDHAPKIFDGYFLTLSGDLVTEEELKEINSLKYLLNGVDFVSGQLAKI